ncbi:host-nuclease inhibitor Gam family protein [Rhizobium sp. YJ-22]|uniref:host-nuclease inhibitor Gam family protein n=1 Tax=Rhizobium sp. YJ-22 TaxID=3037556 RepID=UPI002412874B|nr:host-nuclease inhibitor Gam family protein [Rhizobium sp. YJ-22]MDG3580388.1 host-nuclease inhibitor Gam family protein [Rhizobium sp. YJ-22]
MKKTKAKAIARVPQNRQEAVQSVGRIGELRRLIAGHKAVAEDKVRLAGEQLEQDTALLTAELAEHERGLQTYCEANRAALTGENKVKFHDFGTGRINWRARPASVRIKGVEIVIEAIKQLGFRKKFIRTKEEINKEAMLADPETARKIEGVTITSDGEDFLIEPSEINAPSAMQADA